MVGADRGGDHALRGDDERCGGAPNGVWAIDLDSEAKPVVSWKTNGGGIVGAIAFTADGTLLAAIGPGPGERRARPTRSWRSIRRRCRSRTGTRSVRGVRDGSHRHPPEQQGSRRRGDEDGRVLLLDARRSAARITRRRSAIQADPRRRRRSARMRWRRGSNPAEASWILVPVAGRPSTDGGGANGAVSSGAVVALKIADSGGTPAHRTRLGLTRSCVARHAGHRQWCRVRARDRRGVDAGGARRCGPPCLRRRDGEAALEQWEGDVVGRIAGEHVERPRTDLRRHA